MGIDKSPALLPCEFDAMATMMIDETTVAIADFFIIPTYSGRSPNRIADIVVTACVIMFPKLNVTKSKHFAARKIVAYWKDGCGKMEIRSAESGMKNRIPAYEQVVSCFYPSVPSWNYSVKVIEFEWLYVMAAFRFSKKERMKNPAMFFRFTHSKLVFGCFYQAHSHKIIRELNVLPLYYSDLEKIKDTLQPFCSSLSICIVPLWASTIWRTRISPRPCLKSSLSSVLSM